MDADSFVPLSHGIGLGQRDKPIQGRDTGRDNSGTASLKDLARKVLSRDTGRDNSGTFAASTCPTTESALGQQKPPVPLQKPASTIPAPVQDQREPIDWLSDYEERAAIREYDGRRSRPDAERLAWGEMQNEWHRLHGERLPTWQCAGCLEPIGGQPVFAFPDGARADDDLGCIAQYGKRWRSAATAALVEMGLPKPAKVPEDDP